MPAVNVYGMAIGDTFHHPSEGIIKVEKFELSGSSTSPWVAVVSCESSQPDFDISVKELKEMERT